MAAYMKESSDWVLKAPNQKQKFCLGFLSKYLEKIPASPSSCEWITQSLEVTKYVGEIYCAHKSDLSCPLLEQLPIEIKENPSQAVQDLFLWIRKVQCILEGWKIKVDDENINYDEIVTYQENHKSIGKTCGYLGGEVVVIPLIKLDAIKRTFQGNYQLLNAQLLKEIQGDTQGKDMM